MTMFELPKLPKLRVASDRLDFTMSDGELYWIRDCMQPLAETYVSLDALDDLRRPTRYDRNSAVSKRVPKTF